MAQTAFIVRPFGRKKTLGAVEIDFDRVHDELIAPALRKAGLAGGTTGEIVAQGNIRTDMFELLLTADLVVADISIHNANVFYELGVRQALRERCTFLIRQSGDDVPFDLRTDRYLEYDARNPGASVDTLANALRATVQNEKPDSPVFLTLPELESQDPSAYLPVPRGFREEVELAEEAGDLGRLALLAGEADGLRWGREGLRVVGRAQFAKKAFAGALVTWERVRGDDGDDLEANQMLATIYQRLAKTLSRKDYLVRSDQAVARLLAREEVSPRERAEARSLSASNDKTRWIDEWDGAADVEARRARALRSPHLDLALGHYRDGFQEDQNHFYSGLNALAVLRVRIALAKALPGVWAENFDTDDDATAALRKDEKDAERLSDAVAQSIQAAQARLKRAGKPDRWTDISWVDFVCLSGATPERVAAEYRKVLANAQDFYNDAVRRQIGIYERLGVFAPQVEAVFREVGRGVAQAHGPAPRVVLFTGHRVDAPNRAQPRFPAGKEAVARDAIRDALRKEQQGAAGPLRAIAGGASGGDILFQESCRELGIPGEMYLALRRGPYIAASVQDGGPGWVDRFGRLFNQLEVNVLSDTPDLPVWLQNKPGYGVWQRSNLWMLHQALADDRAEVTLIALWDGAEGEGPGGTKDMVERARDRGAKLVILDTRELFGLA